MEQVVVMIAIFCLFFHLLTTAVGAAFSAHWAMGRRGVLAFIARSASLSMSGYATSMAGYVTLNLLWLGKLPLMH